MQKISIRKPISVLLSILMILSVFVGTAFTASAESSGSLDGLNYVIDDEGVLTFTGSGAIPYRFAFNDTIKKIVINDAVTGIANSAFYSCRSLTEVVFQSCPTLGREIFSECGSLAHVTLPEGMTEIPQEMFLKASSLTEIDIPDTVTSIGKEAFMGTGLKRAVVRSDVSFGIGAFAAISDPFTLVLTGEPRTFSENELGSLGADDTVVVPAGSGYHRDASDEKELAIKEGAEVANPEVTLAEANDMFKMYVSSMGMSPESAKATLEDYYGEIFDIVEVAAVDVTFTNGSQCPPVFGGATIVLLASDEEKAALNEAIDSAKDLLANLEGEAYAEIAAGLQTEIDAAEAVLNGGTATGDEVAAATETLAAATKEADFESGKITVVLGIQEKISEEGDSEEVQAIINQAITDVNALEYDPAKDDLEFLLEITAIVRGAQDAAAAQRGKEFAAYKDSVIASMTEEGDSAEMLAIAEEAKPGIEACTFDAEKTLAENKAAVDAAAKPFIDRIEALRDANKETFERWKASAIELIDDTLVRKNDSDAVKTLIADAKAEINALVYDETIGLYDNEARIHAIVEALETSVATQRAADMASHPHEYNTIEWILSEDRSFATARFICSCGYEVTLTDDAPVKTVISPATETAEEVVKYAVKVMLDGKEYTNEFVFGDLPDTPDQPSQGDNICKWDNVDHGTSFWGRIVKFFHSILYFFAHLFGRR